MFVGEGCNPRPNFFASSRKTCDHLAGSGEPFFIACWRFKGNCFRRHKTVATRMASRLNIKQAAWDDLVTKQHYDPVNGADEFRTTTAPAHTLCDGELLQ